jgi:hypothetical protein
MSSRAGLAVFVAGLVLMISATLFGRFGLQPSMEMLGLHGYQAAHGDTGMLHFLLFAVGFPIGAGLCIVGAGWAPWDSEASTGGRFLLLTLAAASASILVPAVFGTGTSPAYFGTGGVLILGLAAASILYWGRYRTSLTGRARGAADLQACGYLWFAVAAWNLCGVGGMPGYSVYPERVFRFDTQDFAVGQMKAVMLCLVLGWTFTLLGFRRALVPAAAPAASSRAAARPRKKAAPKKRSRR